MGAQFTTNKRCLQFPKFLKVMQRAILYISTEKQEKKASAQGVLLNRKRKSNATPGSEPWRNTEGARRPSAICSLPEDVQNQTPLHGQRRGTLGRG